MKDNIKAGKYNLEERTAVFGERVIFLCKTLKQDTVSIPLISQIVRSSTSVGANYMEANGSESVKDFIHKISLCKKEANETKYWLRILTSCFPSKKEELLILWNESHELTLIFQKIVANSRQKQMKIEK